MSEAKRYYVHDFLIGHPVLVDCQEKSLTFYNHNVHGQIYDLNEPERHTISQRRINGLITRANNNNYSLKNSYTIDRYIYTYLLSPTQKAACNRTLDLWAMETLIISTNSYAEAITAMCHWVYQYCNGDTAQQEDGRRAQLMQYLQDYLTTLSPPAAQEELQKYA